MERPRQIARRRSGIIDPHSEPAQEQLRPLTVSWLCKRTEISKVVVGWILNVTSCCGVLAYWRLAVLVVDLVFGSHHQKAGASKRRELQERARRAVLDGGLEFVRSDATACTFHRISLVNLQSRQLMNCREEGG
jgi:hypothetical protein